MGGFIKFEPLPGAPMGAHDAAKGRHHAAAAIVRHGQWPQTPTLVPSGGR